MSALRTVLFAISLAAWTAVCAADPVDTGALGGAGETPPLPGSTGDEQAAAAPAPSSDDRTAEAPCDAEPTVVADAPTPGTGWRTVRFPASTSDECLRRFLRDKDFVLVDLADRGIEVRILETPRTARKYPRAHNVRNDRVVPRVADAQAAGRKPANLPPGPQRAPEDPARLAWLKGEAIHNPDPGARSRALETLAEVGDHKIILETALAVLEVDRDPRVQQGALEALVDLPSIPLEPVLKLVNTSRSTPVRVQALELLSDHRGGEQQVRELLRTLARSDRDQQVRRTAQNLLNDLDSE